MSTWRYCAAGAPAARALVCVEERSGRRLHRLRDWEARGPHPRRPRLRVGCHRRGRSIGSRFKTGWLAARMCTAEARRGTRGRHSRGPSGDSSGCRRRDCSVYQSNLPSPLAGHRLICHDQGKIVLTQHLYLAVVKSGDFVFLVLYFYFWLLAWTSRCVLSVKLRWTMPGMEPLYSGMVELMRGM